MSEIDVATFMEKNGREFFCSKTERAAKLGEVVEISLELPIRKARFRKLAAHCRAEGVTIPEFLAELLEGWFA